MHIHSIHCVTLPFIEHIAAGIAAQEHFFTLSPTDVSVEASFGL